MGEPTEPKKFEIHKSPEDVKQEIIEKLEALYQEVGGAEMAIYARFPDFRHLLTGTKEKVKEIEVLIGGL